MGSATARADRLQSLESEVHVWLHRPAAVTPAVHARILDTALSDEEADRSRRFSRESTRQAFVAAHGLLRFALAWYTAIAPREWRFASNPGGRPVIAGPATAPPLRFSLSHTTGLVACAFGVACECGVDVETMERSGDPLRAARRVLSPAELADLDAQPGGERRRRFLRYWTLKEAYAKARGAGLRLPFRQVSFALDGNAARLVARETGAPENETWQFAVRSPTAEHLLAVAVERRGGPSRTFCVREGLPAFD